MSEVNYKLSDRPKWWLPKVFKWLAVLLAIVSLVLWVLSMFLYTFTASDAVALGEGNEAVSDIFLGNSAQLFEETSMLMFETIFIVAFLWLIAIGVDKLDQLVWLAASDEDREEILKKRQKNAKNK